MEIKKIIRSLQKELVELEWTGAEKEAELIRKRLAMLQFKLTIGETHDWEF